MKVRESGWASVVFCDWTQLGVITIAGTLVDHRCRPRSIPPYSCSKIRSSLHRTSDQHIPISSLTGIIQTSALRLAVQDSDLPGSQARPTWT